MRIVTDTIDNLHYKYNDSLVHQIKISNTISSLCIVGKENNEIRNQILNIRNIGENVTEIEDYCCYRCNNLTSVKNGDKINRIMNYSFCDCTNLTSFPAVTEGNTKIDEIGTCAFSGTGFKKLKIRFKGGDEKNTTLISCFSNCNNLEEV